MKSKILVGVFLFASIFLFNVSRLYAQSVNISAHDNGWIDVNSYQGKTTPGLFTVRINVKGYDALYPKWTLLSRVSGRITNSENKEVDPSKISIRLNRVEIGPTIQEMGTNTTAVPLSFEDKPIILKSNAPIKPPSGKDNIQWVFYFDIIVAPGAYMQPLSSWNNYGLNLTFTLNDANDGFLFESSAGVNMRIRPNDTPPSEPTYSIQVNSAARNGLLELKTMRDYVEGVSQTYTDGLSVTSTTDYAIQVRSLNINFEAGSNSLPVSAVSLELKDRKNNQSGTIALSDAQQTVFSASSATGKNARLFDIRYFTKPNDERLINAKPASYQTTLMYTLVPQ